MLHTAEVASLRKPVPIQWLSRMDAESALTARLKSKRRFLFNFSAAAHEHPQAPRL
jgi:hypothetical protein